MFLIYNPQFITLFASFNLIRVLDETQCKFAPIISLLGRYLLALLRKSQEAGQEPAGEFLSSVVIFGTVHVAFPIRVGNAIITLYRTGKIEQLVVAT